MLTCFQFIVCFALSLEIKLSREGGWDSITRCITSTYVCLSYVVVFLFCFQRIVRCVDIGRIPDHLKTGNIFYLHNISKSTLCSIFTANSFKKITNTSCSKTNQL
jgi:hypothetical protein